MKEVFATVVFGSRTSTQKKRHYQKILGPAEQNKRDGENEKFTTAK